MLGVDEQWFAVVGVLVADTGSLDTNTLELVAECRLAQTRHGKELTEAESAPAAETAVEMLPQCQIKLVVGVTQHALLVIVGTLDECDRNVASVFVGHRWCLTNDRLAS